MVLVAGVNLLIAGLTAQGQIVVAVGIGIMVVGAAAALWSPG